MLTIVLVRHGHVEGIAPERFRGRQDVPLSATGMSQARATANCVAGRWRPSVVYTSPLQRCVQTGAPIAACCGIPTQVLPELQDLDYGAWQWQTHTEVAAHSPELYARWRKAPELVRFPQGESLQELSARSADALRLALQRHANDTVVMVAHDSSNRVLLLQLLGLPLSAYWRLAQDPCGLSEIELSDDRARILRLNETEHLREPHET